MPTDVGAVETFSPDEARALAPYFTNTDRSVSLLRLTRGGQRRAFRPILAPARNRCVASSTNSRSCCRDIVSTLRGRPRAVKEDRADKRTPGCSESLATTRRTTGRCAPCLRRCLQHFTEGARVGPSRAAYLEQSTRYVPYTDRPDGRWKYHVPVELDGTLLRDLLRPHARCGI